MTLIASGGYGPSAMGMLRLNVASGPVPRFEVAAGVIEGTNLTFYTSTKYMPSTTAVFLNGQLMRSDYANGWVETDPETGRFDMNEPPLAGDVVQVFYLDAEFLGSTTEIVAPLKGHIIELAPMTATLEDVDLKTGVIRDCHT